MLGLDLTLDRPAENLALDEALLIQHETQPAVDEQGVLRFWESQQPIVVVGRGSPVQEEVFLDTCHADNVPVLRRCSGGASIVTGPGCLMYALVQRLPTRNGSGLGQIDEVHRSVLERIAAALSTSEFALHRAGTSDLALGSGMVARKFSGNSLRISRGWLLYHGTILYRFPLELMSKYLKVPPRMPDYRISRSHADFVTNLPMEPDQIKRRLAAAFGVASNVETTARTVWPEALTRRLVVERYSSDAWNLRL